ncbi:MAG: T9SS type A sorting domain-containing protein, partial [Bacteroidota bacterium]
DGLDVGFRSSAQLIDVDGDSDLDLVSGEYYGTFLYYQNDGSNHFIQQTGSDNPLNDLDIGYDSTPQLIDVDGDGDLDLISGEFYGTFLYYQNKPTCVPIGFEQSVFCGDNTFDGLDVGTNSTPQLVDLDADGDLDLVSGERLGTFLYYQNDGSNNFTELTGISNPFNGLDVGAYSTPQLVDLDADGDLDLISGRSYGNLLYYQNDGSNNFTELVGTANPFNGLDIGNRSTPQLIDFDADGDLDLISGNDDGTFLYFQNDGSDNFTKLTGIPNPFDGLDVGSGSAPQLIDLDTDGDLDLVSGEAFGTFLCYQNDGSNNFTQLTGTTNPFDGLNFGGSSAPQIIDLDVDGDLDLISGASYGTFLYFQNKPTCLPATLDSYVDCASDAFDDLDVGSSSAPQLVDLDADGDLDLISGEDYGAFLFFQNDGSSNFTELTGTANPFNGLDVGGYSRPELVDLDADGDLDLVSGNSSGSFLYFQNDGSNNFTELIGTTNPFDGLDVGDRSSPQLIDLDADGDLDLVSGETFGTFLYYQNDGSNNFTELTGTNNPFSGLDVGGLYSTPQLEDVDTDGDLDLVSGNGDGAFLYFQNDGSNNFTKLIGLSNPFAGLNVSSNSTPELIDFDNDGDLDLISGKGDFFTPFDSGTFSFYQNTNLAVSASTVDCASNQAEVELTITSSDTEGPYTLSNAFSGSIGMAGQLGATEVIVTGITESDTYIFEVAVSDGCADLGVAAVVEIDEDCAANGIAVDDTDYIDHGTEEICDASTIRSTAFVGIDVDLTYSASEAIILEPGFEAVNGCAFIARIGGCSAAADNNFVEQRTNEQQHIHINDFVFEETTLHIFPIPTRHFLNYHVEQIKGVQAIYLFDMMGRLVKTDRDLDGTIDISDLPNGQYTLVFEGKGQRAHRLVQKL